MSHVLKYGDRYFRVEITEVVSPDESGKPAYVAWCSEAYKELKDTPRQSLSRFVAGPPLPTEAAALRHAFDWVRTNWDAQLPKHPAEASRPGSVVYTVWLFHDDSSVGFDFVEFSDAKAFASAAQRSTQISKVGIKNNESPQYLTLWEKD